MNDKAIIKNIMNNLSKGRKQGKLCITTDDVKPMYHRSTKRIKIVFVFVLIEHFISIVQSH